MDQLSVARTAGEGRENIELDISHGEAAEAQLDAFIERRARERIRENGRTASQDAATARTELWKASVRRYEEQRRLMARAEWHAYHCGQVERHRRTLEELIAHHEEQARKLLEGNEEGEA